MQPTTTWQKIAWIAVLTTPQSKSQQILCTVSITVPSVRSDLRLGKYPITTADAVAMKPRSLGQAGECRRGGQ